MKIKIIKDCLWGNRIAKAGEILEIDEERGKRKIAAGKAEKYIEKRQKKVIDPVEKNK